jgi:hypothetical protein
MLAQLLAFLGSLFNLCIDTIFKIGVFMLVMFLVVIVIACGLVTVTIWMLA